MSRRNDTLDLREVGSALRHGMRWIVGGAVAGIIVAVLVVLFLPPTYRGRATLLLRGASSASLNATVGARSESGLGGLASVLGGASPFDTEAEVIASRSVVGPVVDSLKLQLRVLEPKGTPPRALFARIDVPEHPIEGVYRFSREGSRYRVRGPAGTTSASPGGTANVGGARLVLRPGVLPKDFEVELVEREPAIEEVLESLSVLRVNGDVVEVIYPARDSITAASVPNAIVARYVGRRKTVDRGVNQTRYEFLMAQTDSIARALALAESDLRQAQESTGVIDPEVYGRAEIEQSGRLRGELDAMEAEVRALRRMAAGEHMTARDIAGFPTLMKNPAITSTLNRLQELDSQRNNLLERRTEADPDVVALTQVIQQLERELSSLARNYLAGLSTQEVETRARLDEHAAGLAALPAQAQTLIRLRREVERLGQTHVALQTQLVQVRLAAIGEGGEMRMLDAAIPPREPAWPNPPLSLALGLVGGLFFGCAGALGAAQFRRRVRHPWEAELAAGAPAVLLDGKAPLLLPVVETGGSVLVLPVGRGARAVPVARQLAITASLRGMSVALADLERAGEVEVSGAAAALALPVGGSAEAKEASAHELDLHAADREGAEYLVYRANGGPTLALRAAVSQLESRFTVVVGALRELSHPSTVAVLSSSRPVVIAAFAGAVRFAEIEEAAATLSRMGVPLAGVVLEPRGSRPSGGTEVI